jgi:lambda repressor-like predicted transcriptional regulator
MKHTITVEIPGSEDLYLAVRAGFVARGTTLNAWCIENGVNRQTAEKALKGERFSRRSSALRQKLVAEALKIEVSAA